jgi:hypothetical protein
MGGGAAAFYVKGTGGGRVEVAVNNGQVLDGYSGNQSGKTWSIDSASGMYMEKLTTPASSSAPCTAGQFTDDANYHYVCVAANTWKRVALNSF